MPSDDALAAELATAAGELLLSVRDEHDDPRDEGDRQSHDLLVAALAQHRRDDAVLSEEADDDKARLGCRRVWIIDPLDGTREFGEPGRDDWAVHVALWEDGELTVGAVALPAQAVTLSTADPVVLAAPYAGQVRLVVSRTRPPALTSWVQRALDAELVPMGSAGAKAMAVVQGKADAYVHAGGQYEWDSAAPVAVARAAGLHTSRTDGSPLEYNGADPLLPDLLICRPELAAPILQAIKGAP
jgi:3'(2'), 5'-bisphosphate nucleotidase